MQEATKFGLWSNTNYFAFITSGKKMWRTIEESYVVEGGDILFIKKGANLTHQFFGEQFCALFIFIPDSFIQAFLRKHPEFIKGTQKDLSEQDAVLRVESSQLLQNYADSVAAYLSTRGQIDDKLISLKLEELLLNLVMDESYTDLNDYFISLCQDRTYHMSRVMEENYTYNLKLEDYAQLCHMSLTTFKKSFSTHYGTSPAKWLKNRKLDLAVNRLMTSHEQIGQVAFESGFQSTSHFIRAFKGRFGQTPLQYRQSQMLSK